MKTILSVTSIPTRFDKLPEYIESLKKVRGWDEIWVNIPRTYTRFPKWGGNFPYKSFGDGVVINLGCKDLGPGTSAFAPLGKTDADILVVVNDDTLYPSNMIENLLKWFFAYEEESVWGLSGFSFDTYFKGHYPRSHGTPVDVLEAYGSCMYKTEWLRMISTEFEDLSEITWNDDMLISNLLEKHDIKRKTVYTEECHLGHLKQLEYGFARDALHYLAAKDSGTSESSHTENNKKILRNLSAIGKNYFKYKPSA